jgi:hypothetical protein
VWHGRAGNDAELTNCCHVADGSHQVYGKSYETYVTYKESVKYLLNYNSVLQDTIMKRVPLRTATEIHLISTDMLFLLS